MPAGKLTLEEIPKRESVTTVTAGDDKTGYAAISEQNERYAAVLGIKDQLPTANADSEKTVSTDSSDFSTQTSKFHANERTDNQPVLIFPSDLTKDNKNKHWVKITIYEVQYNTDAGISNTSHVYVGGQKQKAEFFTDENGKYRALINAKGNANAQNNQNKEYIEGSVTFSNYAMVNKTIALPYPETDPNNDFQAAWGDNTEWGATAGIVEALAKGKEGDIIGALGGLSEEVSRFFRHMIREMPITGKLTKAGTRMSTNPRTEYFFGGSVDVRQPNFTWKFYPKSQKEAETMMEIVDTLKSFVLPSYMQTGGSVGFLNDYKPSVAMLVWPAVFEICFMHGSNENKTMPRFGPLGCNNLKITPISDKWHAHSDGSPVSLEINMAFRELFPIIRDHLNADGETDFYVR